MSVRTSVPASLSAGANPTSSPLTTTVARTNSKTRPSNVTASSRGSFEAPRMRSARTLTYAISAPKIAPTPHNMADSVSSWPTMRPRPAPRDTRTAISRARAAPRASSKLVTLTHASRSSRPVADITMIRMGPRSPTTEATSGFVTYARLRSDAGKSRASPSITGAISALARSSVTPLQPHEPSRKWLTSSLLSAG